MTKQEIEAKISTIRNNNALPEKQKGMLLDKYERMLVDATMSDPNAGKIAPAKEKKARAPRTPRAPKMTAPSTPSMGEPDCDDLFEADKMRKAKAAEAAEKRKNAPKKTEATKNTEAVEKASAKVEKSVEKRIKSGDVSVDEIKKIIAEYEDALKKLRQLLTRAEGKMKHGGPVKDQDISKLADKARDISNHHCGCNDKHEDGGSMYAGGGGTEERFNLSFNYNPGNLSNKDAERMVSHYTKDWKHDNDPDEVSFYVNGLNKKKVNDLKEELEMEDTYNIEITKSRYAGGGDTGKKVYYEMPGIGSAKYTVNFHDGKNTHSDGSPFFDIRTFKSKAAMNNFIMQLSKEGYVSKYAGGGSMYKKGSTVYSSNEMYQLSIFDGKTNDLLTTKKFRARSLKEAKEIAMDDYESSMKEKYGDYLRFNVELAPSLMSGGGSMGWKHKAKK
jgi:hypothetical protein